MNGRRESDGPHWLLLLVCTVVLLVGRSAWAQPTPGSSAAGGARVLLVAPAQAELTARIRGQTRDLGIVLKQAEPGAPIRQEDAAELGDAHNADLVVWAEATGSAQLTLHILERETGRVRSRSVSTPPNETLASSTTAEMGALVVRSELVALLAERTARHDRDALAARVAAPPPTVAPAAATSPAAPQPARPPPRWRPPLGPSGPWLLALAYRASHPINSPSSWAQAAALTARRDLGSFALGLQLNAAFPFSVERAGARIALQRTQLRAEGLYQWELAPRTRFGLGLAASVAFDRRSTEQAEDGLDPTPSAMLPSGSFGLLTELQFRFSSELGGFVAGGADGVPWRTRFAVDDGGQPTQIARLFWLDPWLMVGLFTRFGR